MRTGSRHASPPDVEHVDALVRAVQQEARRAATQWFPELRPGHLGVRLVDRRCRPRCFLYRFSLADGRTTRDVVVKVRHAVPALRKHDAGELRRPVLTPERAMPVAQAARLEYEGLRLLEDIFGAGSPGAFGVLRALAWLPEPGAIVMDHVDEPTLHRVLQSCLRGARLRTPPAGTTAWSNAGAWLRTFHAAQPGSHLPAVRTSCAVVSDLQGAYAETLRPGSADGRLLEDLASATRNAATSALPSDPPLATGHGDFTVRNIFTSAAGRVTVFDPLPLWRVPVYEDLARFVVGMRTAALPAALLGSSGTRQLLDACETAFLAGYFGPQPVPREAALCFQVVLLMDRWATTVSKQGNRSGLHGQRRTARVALARSAYRAEGRRLLSMLA